MLQYINWRFALCLRTTEWVNMLERSYVTHVSAHLRSSSDVLGWREAKHPLSHSDS